MNVPFTKNVTHREQRTEKPITGYPVIADGTEG